jgi:uncharacterized membrane protein
LFIISVAFDLFGIWRRNPAMAKAAYYNLLAAALTAPVAIASGLTAWQWQLEGARLKGNLRLHLIFALSASGMIWLVCGWRVHQRRFPERKPASSLFPMPGFTTRLEKSTAHSKAFFISLVSSCYLEGFWDRF